MKITNPETNFEIGMMAIGNEVAKRGGKPDPYRAAVLTYAEALYVQRGGLLPRWDCIEAAAERGYDLAWQGNRTPAICEMLIDEAKHMVMEAAR